MQYKKHRDTYHTWMGIGEWIPETADVRPSGQPSNREDLLRQWSCRWDLQHEEQRRRQPVEEWISIYTPLFASHWDHSRLRRET